MTSSISFLHALLLLFRHPANPGVALLDGVLPSRFCTTGFAVRVPTWALFSDGHVADLIADGGEGVGPVHVAPYADVGSGADAASGAAGFLWAEGPGGSWKRGRPTRKLQHILFIHGRICGRQSNPCIRKGLQCHQTGSAREAKRRRLVHSDVCPKSMLGRKGIG